MAESTGPDFWPVVAQVAPVLALAVVIEVRVFVRRMSRRKKSKYLASLSERAVFVFMAMSVVVALILAFALALPAVRTGESKAGLDTFAMCCLAYAFGFVVLSPVLGMSSALLADARPQLRKWRRERRIDATVVAMTSMFQSAESDFLDERLRQRMTLADRYVTAYKALSKAKDDPSPQGRDRLSRVNSYLDELDLWYANFKDFVDEKEKVMESARKHLRERPETFWSIEPDRFARQIRELA